MSPIFNTRAERTGKIGAVHHSDRCAMTILRFETKRHPNMTPRSGSSIPARSTGRSGPVPFPQVQAPSRRGDAARTDLIGEAAAAPLCRAARARGAARERDRSPEWFDPAGARFLAQFERCTELAPADPATLTPLQRSLMVMDGTVTRLIEAYTQEPIEVSTLGQATQILETAHGSLQLAAGREVLARHVTLTGGNSGRLFAYASSLANPAAIPHDMRAAMEIQGASVGRLLISSRVESRREILWYGRERLNELPPEVRGRCDGEFLSRTYRIIIGGRLAIVIVERFPVGWAEV